MMVLKTARTFNDEMRQAQFAHRKLIADYQADEGNGKANMSQAMDADLAAAHIATLGAQAASAFADGAQLAALELKLARIIVESQTDLAPVVRTP